MLTPSFSNFPGELRALDRWVVWRGKRKIPFIASSLNRPASVGAPDTWRSFEVARAAYEASRCAGVGFVLNGDGIVGVDLDKCVLQGVPQSAAIHLLDRIGCQYIELSPSGTGLRGLGFGNPILGKIGMVDGVRTELYTDKRYLTITGNLVRNGPLVHLTGFSMVSEEILLQKRTEGIQKGTEEYTCHPLSAVRSFPETTLPKMVGQRNRCVFELARHLKSTERDSKACDHRATVKLWHQAALPVIGTTDFAVTWHDFSRAWERVKFVSGTSLDLAVQGINPIEPLPDVFASLGYGDKAIYLYRICRELQRLHGDEPLFLACRKAGELLGLDYTTAAKILDSLVLDGVLVLLEKGAGRRASRYRCNM